MVYAAQNGRGRRAVAVVQTGVRCAIYTRKSTDEGLDREFNSLEAQRETAESYIASQRDEGWTVLPDVYDDGGFSGATTQRPALQRLLADIDAGKIDCVVVYKYDRLSRSMLDFLQMLDLFKKRGVSFVSVSQRFDTSTPMGEVTLNILLTFAQFERQMTAERTRDKMRAARRRGRWTGGMPPLGYDVVPEGGRLVVNKDEADAVIAIFELYLEKSSLLAVVHELHQRGWRRKSWTTRDGRVRLGRPWNNVDLHRLLTDPIYIGRQKLGNETFKGEHPAIVTKAVFDQVQRLLEGNRRNSGASHRNRHGALLRGILRCASCDSAMTHMFNKNRHGRTYRYYRCVNALKNGAAVCPTGSVPAAKMEEFVVEQIKRIGSDPALCDETFRQVQAQVATEQRGLKAEAKRINRELAATRAELDRLTSTVAKASGPAADALMAKLAETQERFTTMERRQREVAGRQAALDNQDVDPADVGRALAQFTDIWEVLLSPERERVVRLLIDRVDYTGTSGELKITFSATGARHLAADLSSAESTS
jgi:site-specific DNA recombinase